MIETEIKVKYESIIKAQAEIARLDNELARMQTAGESSVEELQRMQDELNSLKQTVSDNVAGVLELKNATAGELSSALDSAEAKLTALSDSVDISKTIMSELTDQYSATKDELEKLTEEQKRLQDVFNDSKVELEKWAALRNSLRESGQSTSEAEQKMAEYSARMAEASPRLRELNGLVRDKSQKLAETNMTLDVQKGKLAENTKEMARAQMGVDQLKRKYGELKESMSNASDALREQQASFQSLAMNLASKAGLAYGFVGLIQNIQQQRAMMQDMETAMSTMLGKDKSVDIMKDLKQLATQSPLAMTDMVGAEKMMVSFGLDAKKSVEYIKALSDISGGNGAKFNSLALAFSQMSSTGKLMGQDLMQMVNQGFNPLDEISRKTGKSIGQLKDEMSKGAISAKMVQDAFISATQEGGKFFGMSEQGSQTINGQLSMLGDAWDNLYNDLGKMIEGPLKSLITISTNLVNSWGDLIPVIIGVGAAYGATKVAEIGALAMDRAVQMAKKEHIALENALTIARKGGTTSIVEQTSADALRAAGMKTNSLLLGVQTMAQQAFNTALAACPYVAAALALAALVKVTWDAFHAHQAFTDAQNAMNSRLTDAAIETRNEQSELILLVDKYKKAAQAAEGGAEAMERGNDAMREGTEQAGRNADAVEDMSGAVSENAEQLRAEGGEVEDNTDKQKELNKAKNELMTMADKYGIKLDDEALKVQNLADTYATLHDEIEAVNKAKAYGSIIEDSEKNISESVTGTGKDLAALFKDKILSDNSMDEAARAEAIKQISDGSAAFRTITDKIRSGDIKLEMSDFTSAMTDNKMDIAAKSALTGPFALLTAGILNWKKEGDFDNLMDKISEGAGEETAEAVRNMLKALDESQLIGDGGAITMLSQCLETITAESMNIAAVQELETEHERELRLNAANAQEQAEDAAAKNKHSLDEIVRRINEADAKIKALRGKMQSGPWSDNDNKALEEAQKAKESAEKEYKQATGKDYGATRDSAKKLKEAELNLEKELYNMYKQERNLDKQALQYQMNKTESLSEQKELQDQILAIEREQAVEDLRRQEAEKLRQIKERKDMTAKDKERLMQKTRELYEGTGAEGGAEGFGLIGMKEMEFEQKAQQQNLDYLKKQEEQLKGFLGTYGDYYDKRMALDDRYDKERKKLAESGVSEDSSEWNNMERARAKELENLGKSYTFDESEWKEALAVERYINDIADKAVVDGTDAMLLAVSQAIAEMESELASLDGQIEQAKLSGDSAKAMELDTKRLNMQKQINKSREVERSLQEEAVRNNGKSGKELERQNKRYEKTKKVIGLVKTAFEELGDVVGEDTKKYMEMVTVIADSTLSVVGSIQGYTEAVNKAMTDSANTSAESVKAVEKASVILAVIGAVIQVATKIASLFNKREKKNGDIEETIARYREMSSIYGDMADRQAEIVANARTSDVARKATDEQIKLMQKQADAEREIIRQRAAYREKHEHSIGYKTNETLRSKEWKTALSEEGLAVSKWDDLLNLTGEELRNLKENHAYLWTQIDDEIKASLENIISLEEQGKDAAETLQDKFANVTLEGLKDSAVDAFKDMSAQAAEVSESIRESLADAVANQAIEERFGKRLSDYKDKVAKLGEGGFTPEEAARIMEEGKRIDEEINAYKSEIASQYGESNLFGSKDDNTTTTGTFAEMSEATANALEARFTAVYESNLRIEGAVTTNGGILGSLAEINSSIAEQIASCARTEAEAQTETQRILAESLLELRDIRANGTGILQIVRSMASDLAEVKNSTAKL